jgi:hypothetical protein
MRTIRRLLTVSLVAMPLAGCATANPTLNPTLEAQVAELDLADEEIAYVCPMHADVTSETPGSCEKCGMALVKGTPFDMRDYRLETTSVPEVPKAGETAHLTFRVVHPGSGEPVTDFELVHEMPFHLFVISQDMDYFQHIHPTAGEGGSWGIDVVLPKPGHYALVADFAPKGASSQMTLRPLVTADADEDLLDARAHLVPDTTLTSSVRDLTVSATFDPPTLVAGQHGHLIFTVTKTGTNAPVTELQTYLGAFGHLFIMNEDMAEYVHSHPVETPSAQLNINEIRGGPTVMFEGLMPRPGRYRAWAQFKYHDEIYTFNTTFEVSEVGEYLRR